MEQMQYALLDTVIDSLDERPTVEDLVTAVTSRVDTSKQRELMMVLFVHFGISQDSKLKAWTLLKRGQSEQQNPEPSQQNESYIVPIMPKPQKDSLPPVGAFASTPLSPQPSREQHSSQGRDSKGLQNYQRREGGNSQNNGHTETQAREEPNGSPTGSVSWNEFRQQHREVQEPGHLVKQCVQYIEHSCGTSTITPLTLAKVVLTFASDVAIEQQVDICMNVASSLREKMNTNITKEDQWGDCLIEARAAIQNVLHTSASTPIQTPIQTGGVPAELPSEVQPSSQQCDDGAVSYNLILGAINALHSYNKIIPDRDVALGVFPSCIGENESGEKYVGLGDTFDALDDDVDGCTDNSPIEIVDTSAIDEETARHPTRAMPGSEEKIKILAARYKYGALLLHHQHDAKGRMSDSSLIQSWRESGIAIHPNARK